MSNPKVLNTLGQKIKNKKEEIEMLEDISDFAKDVVSYDKGYKFNLSKYMNLEETSQLPLNKLNALKRLKTKLNEQEQSSNEISESSEVAEDSATSTIVIEGHNNESDDLIDDI